MIGVYRFILALCVVQGHLLASGQPWLAWQAVFSFYALSGYLMTFILNETYGFSGAGLKSFVANRVLRLFPVYLVVVALTVLIILMAGPLNGLNAALALPQTALDWGKNLSLIGLVGFDGSHVATQRLVPVSWSLSVEIFSYVMLALFVARSPRWSIAYGALGLILAFVQVSGAMAKPDYGLDDHYNVLQAGFFPFALGGLAYFYRQHRLFAYSTSRVVILCLLLCANVGLGFFSEFHRYVSGLYVAALLNMFLVPMLFSRGRGATWQNTLGGMAYPLFVVHWGVGTLIALYGPNLPTKGFAAFVLSVLLSTLAAAALYFLVDRRIELIRDKIKETLRGKVVEQAV